MRGNPSTTIIITTHKDKDITLSLLSAATLQPLLPTLTFRELIIPARTPILHSTVPTLAIVAATTTATVPLHHTQALLVTIVLNEHLHITPTTATTTATMGEEEWQQEPDIQVMT